MLLYAELFQLEYFISVGIPNGVVILQLVADHGVIGSLSYLWVFSLNVSFDKAGCSCMWALHNRPLEISTPKYFALVTTSKT